MHKFTYVVSPKHDQMIIKSTMPVFGVRVSATFHLMCVHSIFSSVWVAEWPPFGKRDAHTVDHMFSLYFDYLSF